MRVESSPISVSSPPIIDVTFRQTQNGDRFIDVLVERTRLNLSIPFFMNLGRFLLDSLPGERPNEGGVINHGYVGDLGIQVCLHTIMTVGRFFHWVVRPRLNVKY